MKYVLVILSIALISACGSDPVITTTNNCQEVEFGNYFEIQVGESACLPDGRSLRLLEVKDEFCPCEVTCDWEGQLVMKIETEGLDENETEITVGSSTLQPFGDLFSDVKIEDVTYLYNGANDSLPLCEGTFDENEITIRLLLSN